MEYENNPIEELASKLFSAHSRPLPAALDHDLWTAFLGSGLDQVLCTGEETSLSDGVRALRAAGRAAAQIPVAEVMLSRWLAQEAGWDDEGSLSTVFTGTDSWQNLPWGRHADAVYLVHEGEIARYRGPFTVSEERCNLAGEPRDDVVRPMAGPEMSGVAFSETELLARGALLKAAMMVGAMEEALTIVLDHAGQRVQFDRPIAQFQAVQQMLADLAAHAAAAGAAVQLAASEGSVLTAAIAKARASEAVAIVADAAHQTTGAMGFTIEFPLHRLSRRLWSWREENGNERFWNRIIGEAAIAHGQQGLWPLVSSSEALAFASKTVKVVGTR